MKSVFWLVAFIFSLILLAGAYYVTQAGMRSAVDARAPWVRKYLGAYIRESAEPVRAAPVSTPAPETLHVVSPAPMIAAPSPTPGPREPFDLRKLATNRAAWPAKVALTKDKEFPAVVDGKVVGSLTAPAGTEVDVVTISGGKIGVEYKGGGAWVFVEETDVVARTQSK
jgi:hypothetical protein